MNVKPMEANRQDAEECIRRAELLLNSAESYLRKEEALNFLRKSIRLFPTKKANELINKFNPDNRKSSERDSDFSESENEYQSKSRHNSSTRAKSSNAPDTPSQSNGRCDHQETAMKMVRDGKTLYDMLGLTRTASSGEISKAYRKLALLLHPDKNKVAGASDCFKAIAKAFKILSDRRSRAQYDQSLDFGLQTSFNERFNSSSQSYNTRTYRRTRANPFNVWIDDDNFSAEEIFNAFFGMPNGFVGRSPFSSRVVFQNRHIPRQTEPAFTNILTLAIAAAVLFLSLFLYPNQLYSFEPTSSFNIKRATYRLHVPYYVDSKFSLTDFNVKKFEREVEAMRIANLQRQCAEEIQIREIQAQMSRSALNKANSPPANNQKTMTPSCAQYRSLATRAAALGAA